MGDEIVERSRRADVDTHLDELLQLFLRGALDRHDHERETAQVFERDSPDGTHRLEHEAFRWSDLAIDADEFGSAVRALIDEPEASAHTQVDFALRQPGAGG